MNSLYHGFEGRSEGLIDIDADLQDGEVRITYSDNGIGISADHLTHIFEPFYTTKHGKGGSGLGLHIVYNIVTNTLGGTITCESELNKFTRFTITFPDIAPDN